LGFIFGTLFSTENRERRFFKENFLENSVEIKFTQKKL
jgi:hypothetical protein